MKLMITTIIFSLFVTSSSFAISEQNYEYDFANLVAPFRDNEFIQNDFLSFDGKTNLNFYSPKILSSSKALLILPGRTEPAIQYFELAYDLKDLGYDTYLYDHRGQGFSDRLLPDLQKGHVEHFDDYAKDLNKFIQEKLVNYDQVDIISHSMGSAIHLRYLHLYHTEIKKISHNIVVAPMLTINFNPYSTWQAVLLLNWFNFWGMGNDYIKNGKPYNTDSVFENSRVTQSKHRWNTAKTYNLDNPELQVGDSTNKWTLTAHNATNKIYNDRKKFAGNNIVYFQSEMEEIVKNDRNKEFCNANPDCTLYNFKESKHGILNEKDSIRNQALIIIRSYLQLPL